MNEKTSGFVIRLCGISAMLQGVWLCQNAYYADASRMWPMGYIFLVLLAPPLVILGWRVAAKRLWAGIALTIFYAFGAFDFLSHRRPVSWIDYLNLSILMFLALTIFLFRRNWRRGI